PGISGRTIFLDGNNNSVMDLLTSEKTATPNLAIPDGPSGAEVTSTVSFSGLSGVVTDVNVKLSITHAYVGDLNAFLVTPTGSRVELFTGVGGNGDNFTNTNLDDEAATSITAATAPFSGTFRPEGLLSAVDGLSPNGNWSLALRDTAGPDTGTLNSWFITIQYGEIATTTGVTGAYSFPALLSGTYTVRTVVPSGWTRFGSENYSVAVTGTSVSASNNFATSKNNRSYHHVYNDANANGVRDAGELPISNWKITHNNGGGGFANTDSLGNATFDLSGVTANVAAASALGFKFVAPATGSYTLNYAGTPLVNKYYAVAENVAPVVTAILIDTAASGQRSRVFGGTVTFSEAVQFPTGILEAFTMQRTDLLGTVTSAALAATAQLVNNKTVVTFTPIG
ncbi:MAG: proprotein convertase P-domain-containing protein, partial [Gemmataceae bacterium]